MVLWIIVIVAGLWLGFRLWWNDDSYVLRLLGAVLGCLCSLIFLMLFSGLLLFFSPSQKAYEEYDRLDIVALRNSSEIHGAIYVMSGIIQSQLSYVFYYKLTGGGIRLDSIPASKVDVYEENRPDAYFAKAGTVKRYKINEWVNLFFMPFHPESRDFSEYRLYVPEGTIKKELSLDLKDIR